MERGKDASPQRTRSPRRAQAATAAAASPAASPRRRSAMKRVRDDEEEEGLDAGGEREGAGDEQADGGKSAAVEEAREGEPDEAGDGDDDAYIMGIDEAGRGPVLGPMVYGAAWFPASKRRVVAKMGFADSKALSAEERQRLLAVLESCPFMGHAVDVISARALSAKMLRRVKYNLNAISHDAAIGLVRLVQSRGLHVSEVYIDTVGDPRAYQAKMSALFPGVRFTVSEKADSRFPVVSAASIAAKVTRDRLVEGWRFEEAANGGGVAFSGPLGSGYAGDPTTKKWLQENFEPTFGYPSLVRFSWSTCATILEKRGHRVDWGDDDEEEGATEARGQDLRVLFGMFSPEKERGESAAAAPASANGPPPLAGGDVPPRKRARLFATHQLGVVSTFRPRK